MNYLYRFTLLIALSAVNVSSYAFTNSIDMTFKQVPKGCFTMGRNPLFEDGGNNELPPHKVCINRPFYLGVMEVTQTQWVAIMGENPSKFKGRNNPVDNVSWDDVQRFISILNKKEGRHYRLPSEAEWEYAARAGSESAYSYGDDEVNLGQYAWYRDNANSRTHPVGQKRPNRWGFYDMYGNVNEWVQDRWHDNYNDAPSDGSAWESGKSPRRMLRGGSWFYGARFLRSAHRSSYWIGHSISLNGFRLVVDQ